MKRILIAVVLMVVSGSLLLTNGQSFSQPGVRLVINEYGTFLNVLNADGTSRFGAFEHGGFRLKYQVKGEESVTVRAGVANSERLLPGPINSNGNSASVTVKTDDGKLEITNEFTFNEPNQLIIRRTLKNNSDSQVSLEFMEEYLDREQIGIETGLSFTQVRSRARVRVRATGCIDNNIQNQSLIERPPHDPPCLNLNCDLRQASLVTPPPTEPISLLWKCPKTLSPHEGSESRGAVKLVYFGVRVTLRDRIK